MPRWGEPNRARVNVHLVICQWLPIWKNYVAVDRTNERMNECINEWIMSVCLSNFLRATYFILRELRYNFVVRSDFLLCIVDFVLWHFWFRCELGLKFLIMYPLFILISAFILTALNFTETHSIYPLGEPLQCLLSHPGLLRDYFGNYTVAFTLAGVPPIVGGLMLFSVPLIHRRVQRAQGEEMSATAHMLPSPAPQPVRESKNCANGDILPGYTDIETHI